MAASDAAHYHLAELKIAQDASSPGHLLPLVPEGCRSILDIGCGAGQTLIASNLADEVLACGIDPDQAALALGRTLTTRVHFAAAAGEALPYPGRMFDLVFSRVALPYTNIPVALAEIARVLRPGGTVWLSLHPVRFAFRALGRALRAGSLRGVIFAGYVAVNGVMLHLLGRQARWPLGRRRFESVQTSGGIVRALRSAGFTDVRVSREKFFVATARLP